MRNMKITQALLDRLTEQAKASPRLRMNLDLRDSEEDTSQRMLNAIEPESVVPIHRHRKSSETVVCLQGRVVEEYYDELERICTERIELSPNGSVVALNIPAGQWHTLRSLESGSVILEVKDVCTIGGCGYTDYMKVLIMIWHFCSYLFWPQWGNRREE